MTKQWLIIGVLIITATLVSLKSVQAVNLQDAFNKMIAPVGERAGFDTKQRNVEPIIGNIISVTLSFLGVIFLILIIYGGYTWMTAMGNEDRVKRAQTLIQAAVLGLIVVVAAYAVTVFVLGRISKPLLTPDETYIEPY